MGERAEVAFWLLKTLAGFPAPVWTAKNWGFLTAVWRWSPSVPADGQASRLENAVCRCRSQWTLRTVLPDPELGLG